MRKKIVRRSWRERRFWLLAKVWQGNSRKGFIRRRILTASGLFSAYELASARRAVDDGQGGRAPATEREGLIVRLPRGSCLCRTEAFDMSVEARLAELGLELPPA